MYTEFYKSLSLQEIEDLVAWHCVMEWVFSQLGQLTISSGCTNLVTNMIGQQASGVGDEEKYGHTYTNWQFLVE